MFRSEVGDLGFDIFGIDNLGVCSRQPVGSPEDGGEGLQHACHKVDFCTTRFRSVGELFVFPFNEFATITI